MTEQKIEQKIEQIWRNATAEDVSKVMNGEKVEARFRDDDAEHWVESPLQGWRCDSAFKWLGRDAYFWNCQVYDPPQWWLDKPDPGEGWRLLEKFPDEPKLGTDEFFDTFDKAWTLVGDTGSNQYYGVWYRRRIEPNSPEKLESSRSKDYIPTGWIKLSDDEPRLASDAYWSQRASEWGLIGEDRVEYANRDKWPAIRQVENWRCMQLLEGCFYRLPNGHGIKVTKKGFEVS
jgi:hypothetical protein